MCGVVWRQIRCVVWCGDRLGVWCGVVLRQVRCVVWCGVETG